MKKALLIIFVVAVAAGVGVWLFSGNGEEPAEDANAGPRNFPARFDETESTAELTQYDSEFGNLAFSYPQNWNATEGADNTAENQLLTVESPFDENEYYFCLDLHVVSGSSEASFAISDAEVLASEALDSGHYSVIYRVDGLDGLQWGVTDENVAVGDEAFTSEISGQADDRVQIFGRFDCRETETPDVSVEEFQDSRWFHEARDIVESLEL